MKRIFSCLLVLLLLAVLPTAFAETADSPISISIVLISDPATGFGWTIETSDPTVAVAVDMGFIEPDHQAEAVGVPGQQVYILSGESAGEAVFTLTCARDTENAYTFNLPVTVDSSLNVLTGDTIALPSNPESDYSWIPYHAEGITEITEPEPGHTFRFTGLKNATDTVYFLYSSPDGNDVPYSLLTNVLVRDDLITVTDLGIVIQAALKEVPDLSFTTDDLDGNTYTEAVFAQKELTILNFWEPWCGPCVAEMPDLQKLSQDYADRIQILGIYATPDSEEDVAAVLEQTGVTYPILHFTTEFARFETGYVPTTVVINRQGEVVYGPFSGSMNYEKWAQLVEELL